jgi:hypothetical protein
MKNRIPDHLKTTIHADLADGNFQVKIPRHLTDAEKYAQANFHADNGTAYIKYYTETKLYFTNYKVSSDCNEILFINTGTENVTVNDILLVPNTSLRISGNVMEVDTTQYYIKFPTADNTGNTLTVLRKLYV